MEALSRTVYLATTEVEPEWENDFNRWYDQEHVPSLLRVPGYLSARRYVAVDGTPKYMAFYEIASLDAYRSPEHDRVSDTPWTKRVRPHFTAQLAFYEQLFPPEGVLRGVAWREAGSPAGGLTVSRLDVAPEHEQDLIDWHRREHLAALCAVPGAITARFFRAIEGGPKFMGVYHLVSPEVSASEAWKKAVDTPWSARVRTYYRTRWRTVYRPLDGSA